MKSKLIPGLLATVLCFLSPTLNGQTATPSLTATEHRGSSQIAGESAGGSSILLRRGQLAFEQAAALSRKQTATDLAAAVRSFQYAARLFGSAQVTEKAAEAHFRAGEIYFTLSRYDRARGSFQRSLEIGREPTLRCKALSRIARTYATTGPVSLADKYSTQALSVCEKLSQDALAEALEARGEALDLAGEKAQSQDYFLRAQDLFAQAKNADGEGQAMLMLAYQDLFSGERQLQGLARAAQALQVWSLAGNRYGIARIRLVLGTFASISGEFETAQCNYKIARPLFREIGNKDDEGSVLNGLGSVSREMGDWQNSLRYFEAARATFASVHDQLGQIEAIRGAGRALSAMESSPSRLPLYQAELRLAREAGDPISVTSALEDTATAYQSEHKYDQAEIFYRKALAGYRKANASYDEGGVLIGLGHLQAAQKKYAQAIESLEGAKALKGQAGEIEKIAQIEYELASIYMRLNRPQDALAAIEKTIDIIEKQRVSISQFDSRASYFASVHQYYALYVEILMQLHQQQPEAGFAERAFDASEKSKVRSLLDLVTTSSQDAPCDELLAQQLNTAKDEEAAVRRVSLETAPAAGSTLTMAEVQDQLEDGDTVIAEYSLGDERSYLWIVGKRSVSSYELPPARQLKKLVERYRGSLQPPALKAGESAAEYQARTRVMDTQVQASARQLSRVLLKPLTQVKAKRILLVPDGSLQYLPFASLPFPNATEREKPLVSVYEIVTLPSASVLAGLRRAAKHKAPPTATAAIFADPVFELDDPRVSNAPAKSSSQDRPAALTRAIQDLGKGTYIPRLAASRNEANAIASVLRAHDPNGVRVALDFDARRDHILGEGLTQFRLVHFATHGLVDTRYPERSGLILSLIDRQGRKDDGYLRLSDVYKLKLSADLVVLSACESALGQDLSSEGIIGLPRAFLHAGAKSVIASLWKVDDEATAKLMADLYARIERGETTSSALRNAQLDMVKDEQWSKPYYWAAFALQGDYR